MARHTIVRTSQLADWINETTPDELGAELDFAFCPRLNIDGGNFFHDLPKFIFKSQDAHAAW